MFKILLQLTVALRQRCKAHRTHHTSAGTARRRTGGAWEVVRKRSYNKLRNQLYCLFHKAYLLLLFLLNFSALGRFRFVMLFMKIYRAFPYL